MNHSGYLIAFMFTKFAFVTGEEQKWMQQTAFNLTRFDSDNLGKEVMSPFHKKNVLYFTDIWLGARIL